MMDFRKFNKGQKFLLVAPTYLIHRTFILSEFIFKSPDPPISLCNFVFFFFSLSSSHQNSDFEWCLLNTILWLHLSGPDVGSSSFALFKSSAIIRASWKVTPVFYITHAEMMRKVYILFNWSINSWSRSVRRPVWSSPVNGNSFLSHTPKKKITFAIKNKCESSEMSLLITK